MAACIVTATRLPESQADNGFRRKDNASAGLMLESVAPSPAKLPFQSSADTTDSDRDIHDLLGDLPVEDFTSQQWSAILYHVCKSSANQNVAASLFRQAQEQSIQCAKQANAMVSDSEHLWDMQWRATMHGLDEFQRKLNWASLAGVSAGAVISDQEYEHLAAKPHKDIVTLQNDVARSHFFSACSPKQLPAMRAQLSRVLSAAVGRSEQVHYTQGLHSLASVLLVVLGSEEEAFHVFSKLAVCQLRDFTRPTLEPVIEVLSVLYPLVGRINPQLGRFLENSGVLPSGFAVAWLLSWFSHDARDLRVVARLFDFFLTSHPIAPLYVLAAAILQAGDKLMQCKDAETLIQTLKGLMTRYAFTPTNTNPLLTTPLSLDPPSSTQATQLSLSNRPNGRGLMAINEADEEDSCSASEGGASSDDGSCSTWASSAAGIGSEGSSCSKRAAQPGKAGSSCGAISQDSSNSSSHGANSQDSTCCSRVDATSPSEATGMPVQHLIDQTIALLERVPPSELLLISQKQHITKLLQTSLAPVAGALASVRQQGLSARTLSGLIKRASKARCGGRKHNAVTWPVAVPPEARSVVLAAQRGTDGMWGVPETRPDVWSELGAVATDWALAGAETAIVAILERAGAAITAVKAGPAAAVAAATAQAELAVQTVTAGVTATTGTLMAGAWGVAGAVAACTEAAVTIPTACLKQGHETVKGLAATAYSGAAAVSAGVASGVSCVASAASFTAFLLMPPSMCYVVGAAGGIARGLLGVAMGEHRRPARLQAQQ